MFRLIVLALAITGTYGFVPGSNPSGRIVGGNKANIKDIPYIASLQFDGTSQHYCAAVIISPKFLLTTAICIHDNVKYQVSVGSEQVTGTLYNVKAVTRHEKYHDLDYDIALLELEKPLELSEKVKPVKMATVEPDNGSSVNVSGWGASHLGGALSSYVKTVSVHVINKRVCQKLNAFIKAVTERMICAGEIGQEDSGVCVGDNSGPLVANETLYGLVSWQYRCSYPEFPGVYTNIAYFRHWIKEKSGV